jgi:hypothetical protein
MSIYNSVMTDSRSEPCKGSSVKFLKLTQQSLRTKLKRATDLAIKQVIESEG